MTVDRLRGPFGPDPDDADQRDAGSRERRTSRRPASSSLSPNTDYRAPGSAGGRSFAPTDHLATEAVAAYVDGELRMNAHLRAARHIAACAECAAEVDAQAAARTALRGCADITMPLGLLGALADIPSREIDLRSALERSRDTDRRNPDRGGPLSAPGFPVHRPSRWRHR